ncbi:MAG: 6-hydroxymethylpterin diphosphokinase MptE-like protein [Gemmatimonadota bacterium]|nr:6-hydroxymethylpterin diphosphokinase MptE-like protein [Gemmatimonadota bacterium]
MSRKKQDFLRTNLDFFARVDPALSQQLSPAAPVRHQVIKTAAGKLNIIRQTPDGSGQPIYTSLSPERDARRSIERIPPAKIEAVIILGTGLGYHLRALGSRLSPKTMFIILEENEDLFRVALRHVDFRSLLAPRPWSLLVGNDLHHLIPILVNLIETGTQAFTCCVIPPFDRICGFAPLLSAHIKQAGTIVEFNRRTRGRLRRRWTSNCVRNLHLLPVSRSLEALAGRFHQVPASIICAGPSLDNQLHQLPRLLETTLTLCTDSALPVLSKMGLKPHFVITMDPFAPAAGTGTDPPLSQGGLICPLTASPETAESIGPDRYFSRYQDVKLWPAVTSACRSLPRLPVSGSVSLYAYAVARFLGAKPIIFVGQDLSFPAYKAYSRGTRQADRLLERADRFHSLERLHLDNVLKRQPVFAKTKEGKHIPTTRTLLQYRLGLHTMCADEPERCINCTGGGIMGGNTADLGTTIEPLTGQDQQIANCWTEIEAELNESEPAVESELLHRALTAIRKDLKNLLESGNSDGKEQTRELLAPVLAPFGDLIHDTFQTTKSMPQAIHDTAAFIYNLL